MVDLFKAETVNSDILIDEKMSIVTADENFEAISGNNALFVYTRYIQCLLKFIYELVRVSLSGCTPEKRDCHNGNPCCNPVSYTHLRKETRQMFKKLNKMKIGA